MNQQYPTTFIQQPLPVPSQIYNQRIVQQQVVQQQQMSQQELSQNYVYQIQNDQKKRFLDQQVKKKQIDERPDFSEMQGGQAPQKSWMGDDVYMVAFLLSVEVERLRDENTQYEKYLEINDSRFRGMEMIENELKQARYKIGDYEKRLALLQNECEQWKTKCQNRERESEDTRYQTELQRRVVIDREIRELTARFISDRNQLESENKTLRSELDQFKLKRSSVDDVLLSAETTQAENSRLKKELDNLRRGFDELEYVLKTAADLEQENAQLKHQIDDLQEQVKFNQFPQQQPQLMVKQNLVQSHDLNTQQQSKEFKLLQDQNQFLKNKMKLMGQTVPTGFM